jgi:hypothetical protein
MPLKAPSARAIRRRSRTIAGFSANNNQSVS